MSEDLKQLIDYLAHSTGTVAIEYPEYRSAVIKLCKHAEEQSDPALERLKEAAIQYGDTIDQMDGKRGVPLPVPPDVLCEVAYAYAKSRKEASDL